MLKQNRRYSNGYPTGTAHIGWISRRTDLEFLPPGPTPTTKSNKEWLMFDKCKTEIFDDVTEDGMAVRIEWLEGSSRCTVSQYEHER